MIIFKKFNRSKNGKLTLDEFREFINVLYKLKKEETLSFGVVRDLFEFIDIRQDGFLDIHEWMQTFRAVEKVKLNKVKCL